MPFLRLIRKLLCPETYAFAEAREQGEPASIKQRGWLQWSCISHADLPSALRATPLEQSLSGLEKEARLLVVSQSCDLVHHCYESEPLAEAYLCEPLDQGANADGNLTAGKNPRELLVPFTVDGVERFHRIRSNGRVLLPRHRLAGIDPDPSRVVPEPSVRILQRWLINRVVRTAFPDAFNDRTGKARNKLESRLKKRGAPLLGLYVNVTPWEELTEGESYEVDFVGLVEEGLAWEQRTAVEKVLGEIASVYAETKGIREL